MLGLTEVFVRLRAFLKLELIYEMSLGRIINVDAGGISLMEGAFCIRRYGEDGAGLSEQLTFVDLCTCGNFRAFGHGFD